MDIHIQINTFLQENKINPNKRRDIPRQLIIQNKIIHLLTCQQTQTRIKEQTLSKMIKNKLQNHNSRLRNNNQSTSMNNNFTTTQHNQYHPQRPIQLKEKHNAVTLSIQPHSKKHNQPQQQQQKKFSFKQIDPDIEKILNEVIDLMIKQRTTILLAKLAKEKLFPSSMKTSNQHHQVNPSQQQLLQFSLQNPLISKSMDEINQHYCTEISSMVIKRVVQYLKTNNLSAKVVSMSYFVDNKKNQFNFSGLTFWDFVSDGHKIIKRTLPSLQFQFDGNHVGNEQNNNVRQLQKRGQQQQQQVSEMIDQEREQQNEEISSAKNNTRETTTTTLAPPTISQKQSLLIVSVYLLRFEDTFRGINSSSN